MRISKNTQKKSFITFSRAFENTILPPRKYCFLFRSVEELSFSFLSKINKSGVRMLKTNIFWTAEFKKGKKMMTSLDRFLFRELCIWTPFPGEFFSRLLNKKKTDCVLGRKCLKLL